MRGRGGIVAGGMAGNISQKYYITEALAGEIRTAKKHKKMYTTVLVPYI